jgi:hypothetical protein
MMKIIIRVLIKSGFLSESVKQRELFGSKILSGGRAGLKP